MKLIGFIKEHNNIKEAHEYTHVKKGGSINKNVINNIIDYLNSGELLLSWMGYFMDLEDGSLIAPDSYYTDGYYFWPAYFPYYLKKYPDYYIDKEFLSHLLECNFIINGTMITSSVKDKLEAELSKKLNES